MQAHGGHGVPDSAIIPNIRFDLTSGADARANAAKGRREYEGLTGDEVLLAYRRMLLSRKVDDKEIQLKNQSQAYFQISGAGHEAILVAAANHLRGGYDWFFPYYRDRALVLTLGVTPYEMLLASVGAKDDPANGGRQMPSHWGHTKFNIPSQSSATGTQALHAIGAAEAGIIYQRVEGIPDRESKFENDEVIYISVGDGTTSEGEFWESLNTACTRSLPVLYLIEDNGYAISVPVEVQTPGGDISRVLENFPNLRVFRVDGTDYFASYRTMREAVAHVRERKGPVAVHATVIRPYSHSLSDDEKLYKTPAERESEARRDPLLRMRQFLKSEGLATDEDLADIFESVEREVNQAAQDALKAPKPEPETATTFVFSPDVDPTSSAFSTEPKPQGPRDTMVSAINATLKDEMAHDPRIVIFGEDVADVSREEALPLVTGKGGVFKVTHGLQRLYGSDRVFNSPLAEANIVGRAVGMALRGLKPVVEIQFFDYIWPAFMQIRDELAMMRYRSANHWSCPVVIRVPIGGYLRGGALSQPVRGGDLRAFTGIMIAFPSNAQERRACCGPRPARRPCPSSNTSTSIDRPTTRAVPGPDYMIPFGRLPSSRGQRRRRLHLGRAGATLVAGGAAAEKDGVNVAVIDLRTIIPYDWDTIAGTHGRPTGPSSCTRIR